MQPDVTEHDTTEAQPLRVGENEAATGQAGDEGNATLPDLNPWTQVGWIFRGGDCVAIERHGAELDRKSRVLAD